MRALVLVTTAIAGIGIAPAWLSSSSSVLPSAAWHGAAEPKAASLFAAAPAQPKAAPADDTAAASDPAPTLGRTLDVLPAPPAESACPNGMVLVEGEYCPEVKHHCKRWMDPKGPYHHFRCAEYEQPARCKSARVKMRFCIDRDEYTAAGSSLPANNQSLTDAARTCAAEGKRVCRESEWNFACEGEEMRPYPYGFSRDASACNADHTDLVDKEGKLKDRRAPSNAYPRCESPFGVRNLSGNLEEMVARDGPGPMRPAMKGAYWQPSRNHCRAAQTAHDQYYHGTETGFRCCADAPETRVE